jgi:hypothetical protein
LAGEVGISAEVSKAFRHEAGVLEDLCQERGYGHRYACNGWNSVNYALGAPAAALAIAAGPPRF